MGGELAHDIRVVDQREGYLADDFRCSWMGPRQNLWTI